MASESSSVLEPSPFGYPMGQGFLGTTRYMWRPSWEKRLAIRLLDTTAPLWACALRPRSSAPHREPERITVLAFWGIGDAVLLTPLLNSLRSRYPNCTIELIGKAFLRDIFLHDTCVDEITVYAPPWVAPTDKYRFLSPEYLRLIRWLARRRTAKNDWIVTTRGDIREHVLAAAIGGKRRFGYGLSGGGRLLTDVFPSLGPKERPMHFAECSLEVASLMGCPDGGDGPSLTLLAEERRQALDFLRDAGWQGERPILGVHIGAGSPIRRWPVERFQRVLEETRDEIGWLVILGDPESNWRRLKAPQGTGHSAFSGPLREVLALLSHLNALLCNDGGIMHAAAALGVKVVAIFGPTSPERFRPYGDGHRMVQNDAIPCRPCLDNCLLDRPVCMEAVTVAQVRDALKAVIRSRQM